VNLTTSAAEIKDKKTYTPAALYAVWCAQGQIFLQAEMSIRKRILPAMTSNFFSN
jgi:hypothetical protein